MINLLLRWTNVWRCLESRPWFSTSHPVLRKRLSSQCHAATWPGPWITESLEGSYRTTHCRSYIETVKPGSVLVARSRWSHLTSTCHHSVEVKIHGKDISLILWMMLQPWIPPLRWFGACHLYPADNRSKQCTQAVLYILQFCLPCSRKLSWNAQLSIGKFCPSWNFRKITEIVSLSGSLLEEREYEYWLWKNYINNQ